MSKLLEPVTLSDPAQIAVFEKGVFWRWCPTCQVTIEHHGEGADEACPACSTPWPKAPGGTVTITGIDRGAGVLTASEWVARPELTESDYIFTAHEHDESEPP
jgi:hypothetical protein